MFLTISHIPAFRKLHSSLAHIQESHFSPLMRSRAQEMRNQTLSSTTSSLTHHSHLLATILSPTLHGIEAHFPYHNYLTQERLNIKLSSQKYFSVLWHPWLEEEEDVCCSSPPVLPCSCFQSFCWSFSLCWLDLHQFAFFCRAHRFLLRPLNYMFNIKHRNRQNTSPCFAKS